MICARFNAAAFAVAFGCAPAFAETTGCAAAGAPVAKFAGLDDRLDLLLDDGRIAGAAGIAPDADEGARKSLAESLAGSEIWLGGSDGKADRWGRASGVVHYRRAGAADAPAHLAEAAIAAGAARYRPDSAVHACRAALLAAEEEARKARRGLWARPESGVLDASDRKAVAAAPPGMTVVEGVVAAVGVAGRRTYLNFGPIRTVDLALAIPDRNISAFELRGLKPKDWSGRRLRARGLLDRRFGPVIEISEPDAIELIDGRNAATADAER